MSMSEDDCDEVSDWLAIRVKRPAMASQRRDGPIREMQLASMAVRTCVSRKRSRQSRIGGIWQEGPEVTDWLRPLSLVHCCSS